MTRAACRSSRFAILVTRSQRQIKSMCDHAAWIHDGTLKQVGDAKMVVKSYADHVEVVGDKRKATRLAGFPVTKPLSIYVAHTLLESEH